MESSEAAGGFGLARPTDATGRDSEGMAGCVWFRETHNHAQHKQQGKWKWNEEENSERPADKRAAHRLRVCVCPSDPPHIPTHALTD